MSVNGTSTDTIDLADIARSLRRGWRWILGGLLAGGLVALLVILFSPRRFNAGASAIIRSAPEPGAGLLSRLGDGAAGAGAASLLGAGASAPIETDIQILSSRAVVGAVVDSLLLQVEVRTPSVPAISILRAARLPGAFKHLDVSLRRTAAGRYHYEAGATSGDVAGGATISLPVGTLTLRDALPDATTLRLYDREDAVRRTAKNLAVSKAGGEVVRVAYRARDSLTAANVPNAVLVDYLARRKTDDRGANAHRVEFLLVQIDSTAVLQASAEERLRLFQEQSGLIDPQVIGKLELETMADLRKSFGALQVEEGALDQLLAQVASGHMTARQLAAFPTFLKSPGINDLLRQLSELDTERSKLLERRLETDDGVVALSRSIANIEGQLVPLARAYSGALRQQRADLTAQIGAVTSRLTTFPGSAQSAARNTREVLRLTQLSLALQSQLVQARLAAISEGGDVRALDRAVAPKEPAFPEPWLTSGLGLGVGLLIGLAAAIVSGSHGRYLDGPGAIERVLGVPAVRYLAGSPLLMTGREATRTLLLIPVEPRTSTEQVAMRLADTASARGETATVLDFSRQGAMAVAESSPSALIARAEQNLSFVVVRLPGLSSDSTAAVLSHIRPVLLVAPSDRVERKMLVAALETLRRLDVPCLGVVLAEPGVEVLASV